MNDSMARIARITTASRVQYLVMLTSCLSGIMYIMTNSTDIPPGVQNRSATIPFSAPLYLIPVIRPDGGGLPLRRNSLRVRLSSALMSSSDENTSSPPNITAVSNICTERFLRTTSEFMFITRTPMNSPLFIPQTERTRQRYIFLVTVSVLYVQKGSPLSRMALLYQSAAST